MKKALLSLIITLFLSFNGYAQIVGGYFPNWNNVSTINDIQWSCLTDVFFAFAQPTNTGGYTLTNEPWLNTLSTDAHANGDRIHLSWGGAAQHDMGWATMVSNATYRQNFAVTCRNLVETYDLDGINLDWEFPSGAEAANYADLAGRIRTELDAAEITLGHKVYLTAAVAPLIWNDEGINATFLSYMDFINVMAFDDGGCSYCGGPNHSSLTHAQNAFLHWTTGITPAPCCEPTGHGMAPEDVVIAIPFYNNGGTPYRTFSAGSPSAYYNDADGSYGGSLYNSCPLIEAKGDYVMGNGGGGLWTWEVTHDRTDAYSLSCCMFNKVMEYACSTPIPDLGVDQSLCGTGGSINLDSQVGASGGRTFVWKRNGVTIGGAASPTYTATMAGTYTVEVTEGGCTETDDMVITATLPTPDLGSDVDLCTPAFVDLVPTNLASFPGGTTWQWAKGGVDISGETSSTLSNVRAPDTYRLTADISGCSATFDEITITSTLPTPVDGCRNTAGTVNLSITNTGGGPYDWYDAPTGGSLVQSNSTTYTTPSIGTTTTYYVEDGSGGGSSTETIMRNVFGGGWYQDPNVYGQRFTVNNALTIDEVKIDAQAGGTVNVHVVQSDGVTVVDEVLNVPVSAGYNTITLNFALNPGTYYLNLVGSSVNVYVDTSPSGSPFTDAGSNISVEGQAYWDWSAPHGDGYVLSGHYGNFIDLQVTVGSSCDRLPVVAQIGGCGSLPVTLTNFVGHYNDGSVDLNWSTASESGNDFFEVQRSTDGVNFTAIGAVDGAGDATTLNTYAFTDDNPKTGLTYYRLAQHDFDGTVNYSEVVAIDVEGLDAVAQPNPFSGHTTIHVANAGNHPFDVTVTNASGAIVEVYKGQTKAVTIGDGLAPGFYVVRIATGSSVEIVKVLKQ